MYVCICISRKNPPSSKEIGIIFFCQLRKRRRGKKIEMLGWIHPTTSWSWIDDVGLLLSSSGFKRKWEIVVIDFNARPRSLWKRQLSLKVVVVVRKSPSRKIGFLKSLSFKGPEGSRYNILASTWFLDLVLCLRCKSSDGDKKKRMTHLIQFAHGRSLEKSEMKNMNFFFISDTKISRTLGYYMYPEPWLALWKL